MVTTLAQGCPGLNLVRTFSFMGKRLRWSPQNAKVDDAPFSRKVTNVTCVVPSTTVNSMTVTKPLTVETPGWIAPPKNVFPHPAHSKKEQITTATERMRCTEHFREEPLPSSLHPFFKGRCRMIFYCRPNLLPKLVFAQSRLGGIRNYARAGEFSRQSFRNGVQLMAG